jgi:hypothetical protein
VSKASGRNAATVGHLANLVLSHDVKVFHQVHALQKQAELLQPGVRGRTAHAGRQSSLVLCSWYRGAVDEM